MDKIGKYEIVRELGTGATSTVYLAIDPFNKQEVAVKLFDLGVLRDTNRAKVYRKLLMTEASLAGKLSHPHIAKILDAVMEGDTNIKISDFGSAALQSDQSTQVSGVGSPAYMSPEQVKEHKLTHQTDIYSLGVVMYKLLTGKLPFDASNNHSMIYHIINIEPPPPSAFRPEMGPELDAIVRRAMEKDTAKRYQTWDEFANDLVGFSSRVAPTQSEILDTEKFDTLRSLVFFKNFSDVELWEVLRISQWRKVPDSEYILRDGEIGRSFFILAQGTVRVSKQGRLLSLLHRGDCFGEMAHLIERDFKRSSDVIAKNDVVLIEISPDVLIHATIGCRLQFGDAFLRMLVKRLSVANTRVSHLLADHNQQEDEQENA